MKTMKVDLQLEAHDIVLQVNKPVVVVAGKTQIGLKMQFYVQGFFDDDHNGIPPFSEGLVSAVGEVVHLPWIHRIFSSFL